MAGQSLAEWESLLTQIENVRQALGPENTQIQIIVRDRALGWLLAENTAIRDELQKLADAGVVFAVGNDALRQRDFTPDQLLPFVQVVDSVIAEIVRKQEAGWAYIRSEP